MQDVEIKEDNLVFDGVFQVKQLNLRFKLFSGEWSPWITREQVSREDAVAVLLFDPNTDSLVLVEQLRIGALQDPEGKTPWLLEIVAGLLERNEDPSMAATREVLEEANCTLKALIPVLDFYTTPGGFTEKTRIYCGIVDVSAVGTAGGMLEEHEDIRIHVKSCAEIFAALAANQLMTSSSTVIALLWLQNQLATDSTIFKKYG